MTTLILRRIKDHLVLTGPDIRAHAVQDAPRSQGLVQES